LVRALAGETRDEARDLVRLERHYRELATLAKKSDDLTESHSVEEARERDSAKRRRQRTPSGK